jgi:hypothetical protein
MIEALQRHLIGAITQLHVMKAVQDEQYEIAEEYPVWEEEGTLDFLVMAWDFVQFEEWRDWANQFYGGGIQ